MKTNRPPDPRPVLLVEDDENDIAFFHLALTKIRSPLSVLVISDGSAAWDYLRGAGPTARPNRPSLVILDLNLPKASGLEILSNLKKDPELRRIPVVVLTGSRSREDVDAAYGHGADFYLVKAVNRARRFEQARAIDAYWKSLCGDPDGEGSDPSLGLLRKLAELPSPALL